MISLTTSILMPTQCVLLPVQSSLKYTGSLINQRANHRDGKPAVCNTVVPSQPAAGVAGLILYDHERIISEWRPNKLEMIHSHHASSITAAFMFIER